VTDDANRVNRLYEARFSDQERSAKNRVWEVLCQRFFQRYVPETATVLDLACGFGEFSRNIRAGCKLAVDQNSRVESLLPVDVQFHAASATDLAPIQSSTVDVCFTSNFFEHLPSKKAMDEVLQEVWRVLRDGGTFMALQPNIRYSFRRYWDFYDHSLALSHLSAREGFEMNGFRVVQLIPRFVPFSTKSSLPSHPALVRVYLALPWLWPVFGRQFFIRAVKLDDHPETPGP
jgi:SAM-dependent methyltransferase